MEFSIQMNVAITEAKSRVTDLPKAASLIERLQVAMQVTKDHWMCTNEDERFRSAIVAVMLFYGQDSEEWKRLAAEMEILRGLGAFFAASAAGLSVDPSSLPMLPDDFEIVGLMKLWHAQKQQ